ncbi:MAG: nitroreductase family deazaflavin-dependent oxidoreductase [Candidatus Actinomarina sp.]|nr:nitroreductase family deazaflavin-dependent oxidoreductase [Actinomycetota bacterium]MBL6836946.1 nitroreductase family deazaflavin-dependent oxidoreductase [Candidatus Actinomarina sp.]MDB4823660.1 nitroreductase family deazaflavin-dependent oxidoreductase [Acidimicrobiia bacterium]
MKLITFLHVKSIKFNHSKVGQIIIGSNILLLETRGVVSNKIRKTPLTYAKTENGYVVAASYGGRDTIPQWFNNLQDNLNYITVESTRLKVKHEIIPLENRAPYWEELIKVYKTFEQYKEKTQREIPLVEFTKV